MVDHLVIAPLLVALTTAIATVLTRRSYRVTVGLSAIGIGGYGVSVIALANAVFPTAVRTYQLSGWPAPFGISLVADALSVFMLILAASVVIPALLFAITSLNEYGQRTSFHTMYHFMVVGVTGAFLTGDVFNLFVWFEVMLLSSYVLVGYYGGPQHTGAALRYAVLNLVGSAFMLVAIGGLYATLGTLNMADMANRLATPARYGIDPLPVLGLAALLLAVFALKAGLVPFQFWVPAAYRSAPAPVSAVLAGVAKKVGVYAIIRLYFTVFAAGSVAGGLALPGLSGASFLGYIGPLLFVMAAGSITLGGIAAIGRDDLDELLAYSSIAQVGFIVLPLAIGATVSAVRRVALIAALVYALNHAIAKGLLYITSGALFESVGSIDLREISGLADESLSLTAAFFVGGLTLIGIPPLSGFFGKLLVFDTATRSDGFLALAVALGGAVLTVVYVSRAWTRGFWGPPREPVFGATVPITTILILLGMASAVVFIGVGFEPVFSAAGAAADAALARADYIDAVGITEVQS